MRAGPFPARAEEVAQLGVRVHTSTVTAPTLVTGSHVALPILGSAGLAAVPRGCRSPCSLR